MSPRARPSLSSFLELVARDRDERSGRVEDDATRQARAIVQAARLEARRRVGAAVREDRERARRRIEAARADLATREREVATEVARTLLARGWERLLSALEARWQDASQRRRWIEGLVADAGAALPRGPWQLRCPAGLAPDEREALAARAGAAAGAPCTVVGDPRIVAGIVISGGGATLDGTLDGLLAERSAVEGRVLIELAHGAGEPGAA